jgi:hypothetical protein
LSAPLAEVTTHWDGGGWFSADPVSDHLGCEWELGRAERRDDAIARGDWLALAADGNDAPEPPGPYEQASMEIVVDGEPQRVAAVSYRHYQAFSFLVGQVNVTVVTLT